MQNNNFNTKDDFVIGKGFNFEETEPIKNKRTRKKKKSVIGNTIWIGGIILLSVAIAFSAIYPFADFFGIGFGRGEEVQMDVPYGSSTAVIAEKLEETGAVKIPLLFRVYSKLKGYDSKYKYGLYTFNTEAGYDRLAEMLMYDGAKAKSVSVTIPEGTGINDYTHIVDGEEKTVKGIATILEEKGVCKKKDFIYALGEIEFDTDLLKNCNVGKTYYSLEGYLFPDTYDFYAPDGDLDSTKSTVEYARLAIEKMIKQTESKITPSMYKRAEKMGYSMNEILTMASIIQMESGQNTDEMPSVAAVFYNRLKSKDFSTLGSSPTCYYGESFRKDDGRYNTYDIKGIPPGPLCSPGLAAINAALNPSDGMDGIFYFVTDKDGKFYYSKTGKEHTAIIDKLQNEDNWVYETFE